MKKVIRLTEDDLSRIVKRVVKEQSNKRLLREQQENDLVGKTIDIFSDKGLTTKLATVKVASIKKSNNGAIVTVNGVTLSDGKFMDKFQITCESNVISFTKILALPGNVSQENSSGYVSQKLVDYLKPIICQQEKPQQPQAKSDF